MRQNLLDPVDVEDHLFPQGLVVIGAGYGGLFLDRAIEQFYTKHLRVGIGSQIAVPGAAQYGLTSKPLPVSSK
jgi:hypothetical protein